MKKLYNVNLWEERVMPFAIGIVKDCDTLWARETIYSTCVNGFAIKGVKGINGIHVVKTLSGNYWVNQISGYTADRGMYCMLVNKDGTMKSA